MGAEMKRKILLISGVAVMIVIICMATLFMQSFVTAQNTDDPVILRTKESLFTESEVSARMEMYCQKYSYTTDALYDTPEFWNQMVKDIVYEYAGAEIAREISDKIGLGDLDDGELKQAQTYYDTFLSDIEKMGENKSSFLKKLGFSEETLWTFSENQVYKARLIEYWAQDIELSDKPEMVTYEKLLNYTRRTWEEINAGVDSGEYVIDETSLLQKIKK